MDGIAQKKKIKLSYFSHITKKANEITVDSMFDSGNVGSANLDLSKGLRLVIYPQQDTNYEGVEVYSRSWFYFSLLGFQPDEVLTISVRRISALNAMLNKGKQHFRPVYKFGTNGDWQKTEKPAHQARNFDGESEATWTFKFDKVDNISEEVYFAFTYPYDLQDLENDLNDFDAKSAKNSDKIYYKREHLTNSHEKRRIDLITISSRENIYQKQYEPFFEQHQFPKRNEEKRCNLGKSDKPIVFLSSRVHPGEVPASYGIRGVINKLLDVDDPESQKQLEMFVFKIIPMINPDGVYRGHLRMDGNGVNLNRFYNCAERNKQPSVYAQCKMVDFYDKEKKIVFFADFHSHHSNKDMFVFGNFMGYLMQVESKVFCKVASINNRCFCYDMCNFSKKQMKSRDCGSTMTKEGSARVAIYKKVNIPHSYTLEFGYHQNMNPEESIQSEKGNSSVESYKDKEEAINKIEAEITHSSHSKSINLPVSTKSSCLQGSEKVIHPFSRSHANNKGYYTSETFEQVGKDFVASLIDIFYNSKNSEDYFANNISRKTRAKYKNVDEVRTEVALDQKDEYKRREANFEDKYNNINDFAKRYYKRLNDEMIKRGARNKNEVQKNEVKKNGISRSRDGLREKVERWKMQANRNSHSVSLRNTMVDEKVKHNRDKSLNSNIYKVKNMPKKEGIIICKNPHDMNSSVVKYEYVPQKPENDSQKSIYKKAEEVCQTHYQTKRISTSILKKRVNTMERVDINLDDNPLEYTEIKPGLSQLNFPEGINNNPATPGIVNIIQSSKLSMDKNKLPSNISPNDHKVYTILSNIVNSIKDDDTLNKIVQHNSPNHEIIQSTKNNDIKMRVKKNFYGHYSDRKRIMDQSGNNDRSDHSDNQINKSDQNEENDRVLKLETAELLYNEKELLMNCNNIGKNAELSGNYKLFANKQIFEKNVTKEQLKFKGRLESLEAKRKNTNDNEYKIFSTIDQKINQHFIKNVVVKNGINAEILKNDTKGGKKPKLNKTHKFSQKATITPNKGLFQSGPIDYNDCLSKDFKMLQLKAVNSYEEDTSTQKSYEKGTNLKYLKKQKNIDSVAPPNDKKMSNNNNEMTLPMRLNHKEVLKMTSGKENSRQSSERKNSVVFKQKDENLRVDSKKNFKGAKPYNNISYNVDVTETDDSSVRKNGMSKNYHSEDVYYNGSNGKVSQLKDIHYNSPPSFNNNTASILSG